MNKHELDNQALVPPSAVALGELAASPLKAAVVQPGMLEGQERMQSAHLVPSDAQGHLQISSLITIIVKSLSFDDLKNFRLGCRFFKRATDTEFILRSLLQYFQIVLPVHMMTALRAQKPEVFERLLAQIRKDSSCRDLFINDPDAGWGLCALLNLPDLLNLFLGKSVATAKTRTQKLAIHFYARVGLKDTFISHISTYCPEFKYDPDNPDIREVADQAILGGQHDFYSMLVNQYGYPDYKKDKNEALRLLSPAIAGGQLDNLKRITDVLQEGTVLTFDYIIRSLRSGCVDLYNHLVSGENPFCRIRTKEEATAVFLSAAQFDILSVVRYFLEDTEAKKNWGCTLDSEVDGETVFTRALLGGSHRVFEYLLTKDSGFVSRSHQELSPLFYSAKGGNIKMCRVLIEEHNIDPHVQSEQQECSLHYAAESGNYNSFYWLFKRDFNGTELPQNVQGLSPFHIAARRGRYSFLRQAFIDFSVEEFKKKTSSEETLLHFAFGSGNLGLIDFLVDECDLSLRDVDKKGNTPLHRYFAGGFSIDEQIDFVTQFVEKYDPKLFIIENHEYDTPFTLMPAQCEELIENRIGPLAENEI